MSNQLTQAAPDSAGDARNPSQTGAHAQKAWFKKWLGNFLKIGFSAGLIYWMFHKGALDLKVFAKLASPWLIALLLGCVFVQIFINNYRWLLLMRGQGFDSSIRRTLPLSFIGMFFSFVMPGGVGGDVVKGYYLLQDHPQQRFAGVISVFMDRMIGFFVMVATAFLAVFFNWSQVAESREMKSVAFAVTGLFLVFLAFFVVSHSRRIGRKILTESWFGRFIFEKLPGGTMVKRVYEVVHSYRNTPSAFFNSILLSFVNQLSLVLFFYLIGYATGETDIPVSAYFFLVPIGIVVTALPISPAGIGVGQAAFYFLFSLYLKRPSQAGITGVTAIQLMNFAWGLVGAYFYLHRKKPVMPAEA